MKAFALVAAGVFAACGPQIHSGRRPAPPIDGGPTVETTLGTAVGTQTSEGVSAFLGLPYAEPPVGELRFSPPVPIHAWNSPVNANSYGSACIQPAESGTAHLYDYQSEDCLTLNVWTPAVDNRRRPVMVWVHGGGWVYEGTEDPLYSGAHLAARGDVVVVSIEYRLGVFGFSQLDDIPGSGNAGLLDQVLALSWVRDHIADFGGDPTNVTLFGESAGAMSVTTLMAMPAAKGLFKKAIAQSGAGNTTRTEAYAQAVSRWLLAETGTTDARALRALTADALRAAQDRLINNVFLSDLLFGPVVDGTTLPASPLEAIANGSSSEIPLMTGTTRDETRLWILDEPLLANASFDQVANSVPFGVRALPVGTTPQTVIDLYSSSRPGASPGVITHAAATDIFFRIPAIRLVEAQLLHQPRTFLYRFDWVPPAPESPNASLGAMHGAELAFVLGSGNEGWLGIYGPKPIPSDLMHNMMDAWLAFARNGDPNQPNMPQWQAYDTTTRATVIFDEVGSGAGIRIINDPDASERAFWSTVPFDGTMPTSMPSDLPHH